MKKNERFLEVFRFAVAGALSFGVEFVALVLLREKVGLDTLVATPLAFLLSVVVNYLLCVRWVFAGAGRQSGWSRSGFLLSSAVGLLLNEGLMLLFRLLLGEEGVLCTVFSFPVTMYMLNKVLATLLVMVWNYFTKRWILKKGK